MKPTKIIAKPWIEPNGKRGMLIFHTDKGMLSCKETARLLDVRPGTLYERFRRCGKDADLEVLNRQLFRGK